MTKTPMISQTHDTWIGTSDVASVPQKRLAENQMAIRQIKELWDGGLHNETEIAKRINYPKETVAENIKKLKKEGLLVD